MEKRNWLLFLFVIFISLTSFSQSIKGKIKDSKTNEPIEGASVYFDNTTIGVISNMEGYFEIPFNTSINTPLVISFLGYEKVVFTEFSPDKVIEVNLIEDVSTLSEVVLNSKDSWSREYKLRWFRTQFLGLSENSKSCKILNEDDIKLEFLEDKKKLVAWARKPLIIVNDKLKYRIEYDLQDFEIQYKSRDSSRRIDMESIFYYGTSLYKSFEDSRRILKRRLKSYEGSRLHFMRSLLKGKLTENKFTLLHKGRIVPPINYISVYATDDSNLYQIRIFKTLTIVYNQELSLQSKIIPNTTYFYLDTNGNHAPVDALTFSGIFGNQRVGDTLPLDYKPFE